jgi:hypothetical protein
VRELKEAHMALKDEVRKLRCDKEQDTQKPEMLLVPESNGKSI